MSRAAENRTENLQYITFAREDGKYIGTPVPRTFDGYDKVRGFAEYINDVELPGMLYAYIMRSPISHGIIKRLDYEKLFRRDHVKAIITGKDAGFSNIGPLKDNPPLKYPKIRSIGDEILAVATTDLERVAKDVQEDVEIDYERIDGVFDTEQALRNGAPLVHDETGSNVVKINFNVESGSIDEGFRQSYLIREDEFDIPRVAFAPLGTLGAVATFDESRNLVLISNTQQPFQLKRELAEALNYDPSKIRIVQPYIGGTFGRGMALYPFEVITAALALKTGRPVKILLNRTEDFKFSPTRQPVKIKIKSGVDRDGKMLARDVHAVLDTGAYVSWGAFDARVMASTVTGLYKVSNVRFDAKAVYTNNIYTINMRGAGNPQMDFALESHLDMLADELGMDPLKFRLINSHQGDYLTPQGMFIRNSNLKSALEKAAKAIGWKGPHMVVNHGSKKLGIGFAGLIHVGGGARVYHTDGSGAVVKMDDYANITLFTGISELGQGSIQSLSQIVASEIGVPLSKVNVVYKGDSEFRPWDTATHASRGTFVNGGAAQRAAGKLKAEIIADAAMFFKTDVQDLVIEDGIIKSLSDSSIFLDLGKFIRKMHFSKGGKTYFSYYYFDPDTEMADPKTNKGNISSDYVTGATAALVEVDTETGAIKPLKLVIVNDCGTIINPSGARGQIIGGAIQAIGHTLFEELALQHGEVVNTGFSDYEVPGITEVPEIQVEFIESRSHEGPFGAKGIAEMGIITVSGAINNAVFDATGARLNQLPLWSERVLKEIEKSAAQTKRKK